MRSDQRYYADVIEAERLDARYLQTFMACAESVIGQPITVIQLNTCAGFGGAASYQLYVDEAMLDARISGEAATQ